jgi:hypothetical protein
MRQHVRSGIGRFSEDPLLELVGGNGVGPVERRAD